MEIVFFGREIEYGVRIKSVDVIPSIVYNIIYYIWTYYKVH